MTYRACLPWLALAVATAVSASPAPNFSVLQQYPLGGSGGWDYLTIDPAAHHLFIVRNDRLMVLDSRNGKLVSEIPGLQHAHGMALVTSSHRGYVSNGAGNSVSVIDLEALKNVGSIAITGSNPDAIVFDPASGHVMTMNGRSNSVSVIDPAEGKEVATITLPGRPEFAVSDGHGHVFVNLEDKNQLAQLDSKHNTLQAVWDLTGCESPSGLALDPVAGRLFSVCDNQHMVVTDAHDGHQVAQLAIGKGPDAAAFDPQTKLVYSSNHDGTLTIVHQDDGNHYTVLTNVTTREGARTLALDPSNHHIWLVTANPAPRGTPVTGFMALVVGSR